MLIFSLFFPFYSFMVSELYMYLHGFFKINSRDDRDICSFISGNELRQHVLHYRQIKLCVIMIHYKLQFPSVNRSYEYWLLNISIPNYVIYQLCKFIFWHFSKIDENNRTFCHIFEIFSESNCLIDSCDKNIITHTKAEKKHWILNMQLHALQTK